jgi:hypothetical protein
MNIQPQPGFKATLIIVGAVYASMACSMVLRGPAALAEFGVPERVYGEAVLGDFFMFFYQLMAGVGVLIALLGYVARERRHQLLVSSVLCVANILVAFRDLATSDSALGSRLYGGPKTLVFVAISLALALVFGVLALGNVLHRVPEAKPNHERQ